MAGIKLKQVRLSENGQDPRRDVLDALAALRTKAGFGAGDHATIEVGLLQPPSRLSAGLVEVVFACPRTKTSYRVPLRTAAGFRGRRRGGQGYDEYDIARLSGAEIDADGTVVLPDGTVFEAVETLSAPMVTDPSETDWRIIHLALSVIEGGDRCYRSLQEGLPPEVAEMVPDQRYLDCGRLSNLSLPPLKVIAIDIRTKDPTLRVTEQKIADALRKFGVRVPSSRPRRRANQREDIIPVG
jgi:hypothetical protein